jgi:FdhD protein
MGDLHRKIGVSRWNGEDFTLDNDHVAIEALVIIRINGDAVANLLATPSDLQDLAIGHCIAEAKTGALSIESFTTSVDDTGTHFVDIITSNKIEHILPDQRIITSSCGACDRDGVDALMSNVPLVSSTSTSFSATAINIAFEAMRELQIGFSMTGGVHAAGLIDSGGNLVAIREDIGRHNAVDKLFGFAQTNGLELNEHGLLLSGRCGWDIVAKSARMNCPLIASIGASSTLAIEAARQSNITLFSFVRSDKGVVIGPSSRLN